MFKFKFDLKNQDGQARAGEFFTQHGSFKTPIFMPVGTKASVKGISVEDLNEMGAEIILNNTYHLFLRPGDKILKKFGGAHKFQNYNKPILTDSGGFQVFSLGNLRRKNKKSQIFLKFYLGIFIFLLGIFLFSLTQFQISNFLYLTIIILMIAMAFFISKNFFEKTNNKQNSLVKIKQNGVYFKSFIDGKKHFFDPKGVMDIQSNIGADIIMTFDECAAGNSSWEYAKQAMDRTHIWALECVERRKENNKKRRESGLYEQVLFPIVQGVNYKDLRIQSVNFMKKIKSPGIAIGGLSVGEDRKTMYEILDTIKSHLPKNKARYLMGVGTPQDLIEGIYRGIDMFDCVLPTRLGRHGVAFSFDGNKKILNRKYKFSKKPIEKDCSCKVCKKHSMGYLRHLIKEQEILGMQLLSYHNLYFLIQLAKQARESILENKFEKFRKKFWKRYPKSIF